MGSSSFVYKMNGPQSTYEHKKCERTSIEKKINLRIFKSPNELPDQIYELRMNEPRIEQKKPIFSAFYPTVRQTYIVTTSMKFPLFFLQYKQM